MSETAVDRRLRDVEHMYRSIPGMCSTRHEQDLTADAIDAGREAIALLQQWIVADFYGHSARDLRKSTRALLARCEGE